jgi:predicted O-methyltransferase YrrM
MSRTRLKYSIRRLAGAGKEGPIYEPAFPSFLSHSIYAWLGLRPVLGQHTSAEHAALVRLAAGRSQLVEIGVAEGVSAMALRDGMRAEATLTLVDPFHLSRVPLLNFTKRAARRALKHHRNGTVAWLEQFSHEAVGHWKAPIDLLLIDGDHGDAAVERDWNEWSRHVMAGGIVILHDARLFEGGWTTAQYGPVKLVDKLFRKAATPGWFIAEEIHSLVVIQRDL